MWWSSLLEHCPKWGKNDGHYDSPTSRDETDEKEKKEKEKKENKKNHKKKKSML